MEENRSNGGGNPEKSSKIRLIYNIITIVAALSGIIVFILFILNFTFGFVPLLLILFLFLVIIGIKVREFQMQRARAVHVAAIIVAIFGFLCLYTLDNYVNPPKAIFTNNDHHALVAEGFHIKNPQHIVLAGNRADAIFDNESFGGDITLGIPRQKVQDGDTIRTIPIRKNGFSIPIYSRQREVYTGLRKWFQKEKVYFKDIDSESDKIFFSDDVVTLKRGKRAITLCVKEYKDSLGCQYFLNYTDETGHQQQIKSSFTTYLRKSYPLSTIFQDVDIPNFSLDGITLFRTVFFDTQIEKVKKNYDRLGAGYRLAFEDSADHNIRVQINGQTFNPFQGKETFDLRVNGTTVYAIGSSEEIAPQFRLYPEKEGISLRFRMPKYRYLSANYTRDGGKSEELSFMVASTILAPDGSVSHLIPENILLYDIFDRPDNIHQLQPTFLSFNSGPTNKLLKFSLYSADGSINTKDLTAGSLFPELPTSDKTVTWIISADNFKDAYLKRPGEIRAPLSPRRMAIILIAVTLLSVMMLYIRGSSRYTYIEPVAYMILMAFLTIRLFLLWRISVFPPVMSTTISEFNGIFRASHTLDIITILLVGFYAVIFLVKRFGLKGGSILLKTMAKDPSTLLSAETKRRIFLILICGLPTLSLSCAAIFSLLHVTSRIVCILLPLLIFFSADFVSNRIFGGRYRERFVPNIDLRYLWILIVNSLSTTAYCFVRDGGFGIIFLIFSIANISLRLVDAYLYKSYNQDKEYINRSIYLLSILAAVTLASSKWILLQLLDKGMFALVFFGLTFITYICILSAFNIIQVKNRRLVDGKKALKFLGIGLAAILVATPITTFLVPKLFEGKHIEYRLKVQAENPGKVLGKLQSSTEERKFLEASINDWIMGEYNLRAKSINIVGEKGQGYFKTQPQSKIGALWGAQTTDISLSRYIIAEHGCLLAVLLIGVLGTLLILCFRFVSNRVWSKALITQIPLLLSVQALLVWMAVTKRFIFLGQDFPMISITSNLTSTVFICLMLILILAALIESTLCRQSDEQRYIPRITNMNCRFSKHVFYFSLGIIGLLVIWGNRRGQSFYQPIKKSESATLYNVASSLEALKLSIKSFNEDFTAYQQQILDSVSRQSHRTIRNITKIPIGNSPYQCLQAYCRNRQYNPDASEETDNQSILCNHFDIMGESYSGFCKMAFDRYLKAGAKKNDIEGLIFTVKKKSRVGGVLNVVYELKVNDWYYNRELPRAIRDSWKGNIVSAPIGVNNDTISPICKDRGFIVYTLPKSWTRTNENIRLLKSTSQSLVVVGKQSPQILRRGEACNLRESDNVLVNGKNTDVSKYGNISYLAKNVLINGVSTFIYPLQHKLFWIRPFADCVRADRSSYDIDSKASDKDVCVTLSPTLTSDLYDTFEKMRPGMMSAAVVADGNGNILAMVDHKDPSHRINPNDIKSIIRKENELRLEGEYYWGQEAENYFGNKAITNLRYGPGSSQKPLVWTAVTTQYNDPDFWQQLKLARINPYLMENSDRDHFSTRYIAGTELSRGNRIRSNGRYAYFQSIKGDEGGGTSPVDLTAYIYKSSNYYNTIMSLIGSYSYDDLTIGIDRKDPETSLFKTLDQKLLISNQADDSLEYRQSFPIMQLGNGKPFAFKEIPSSEIIDNADNSLLVKGLHENLNLPSTNDRSLRPEIYRYETEKIRNRSDFAHPQESYFLNKYRNSTDNQTRADYAIRYTALGASSVWQVSPLMMAQMYGGMISLNKNYSLSIMSDNDWREDYERFDIDNVPSSYDNLGSYFDIRSTFVNSLSMVFHANGGTGKRVFDLIQTYRKNSSEGTLSAEAVDGTEKKLYFYGKTGTINGTDNMGRSHVDHLLAVIITDTDIQKEKSIDKYEQMKFYVIYMADFDIKGWIASDAAVIDVVLSSKEFKHYMGLK